MYLCETIRPEAYAANGIVKIRLRFFYKRILSLSHDGCKYLPVQFETSVCVYSLPFAVFLLFPFSFQFFFFLAGRKYVLNLFKCKRVSRTQMVHLEQRYFHQLYYIVQYVDVYAVFE